MKNILVTGASGFIGFHLSRRLLELGMEVTGIDNLNSYYDPKLKESRLAILEKYPSFRFVKADISDKEAIRSICKGGRFEAVVHLAAQAGVRYSVTNPDEYISSNIVGFHHILEAVRAFPVKHLVYASSSSVYGGNEKIPFSTNDPVDHPVSLYAATKKSNELMAHTYSHLYRIPTTGLRFFTVYGPWGRPDMALYKFAVKIRNNEPIDIYNNGDMMRDFTYIDDIVECIVRVIPMIPQPSEEELTSRSRIAPYRIFNIGSHRPVNLMEYIKALEKHLGQTAQKNFLPIQPGDVKDTYAEVSDLVEAIDYAPSTDLDQGIRNFVDWFDKYYVTG